MTAPTPQGSAKLAREILEQFGCDWSNDGLRDKKVPMDDAVWRISQALSAHTAGLEHTRDVLRRELLNKILDYQAEQDRARAAIAREAKLREVLERVKARANSLQNSDSHIECIRQLACIDIIASGALTATAATDAPTPAPGPGQQGDEGSGT